MKRSVTLMAALTVVALAAPASAGYVALGVGPSAGVHGEMADHFTGHGGSSGRLVAGQRLGPFAIEASLFGSELAGTSALTAGAADYSTVSIGVDGKIYVPIAMKLEGYVRAGLNKTWIATQGDMDLGYSGTGTSLGLGAQFNFSPIPLLQAALFVDYGRQFLTLNETGRPSLDGEIGMITIGLAVGTSF